MFFSPKFTMAVLSVNNVTKMFGTDIIIKDVSFEVQTSDHIGLVGINGSGKTTLFKVLSGEYQCDVGAYYTAKETVLGYMEQHVCSNDDFSAYAEVLTVFSKLIEMEEELNNLNQMLLTHNENTDELINKQVYLTEKFADLGGLTFRNRAKSTLAGLGFTAEQMGNPVGVLSGGQKSKLQLAKMLLSGSNFLLLDEPTNHLDIDATQWLEDFLKNYNGAFIVISHDRYFLDKVTNNTFEIENKKLYTYKGNYTAYVGLREQKKLTLSREYESTAKEIKRIEGIIEQQKRFNQARNYVTIASKQKSIDRLEATLERPEEEADTINFEFKPSRRGGNDVLTTENLSLAFGDNKLFSGIDIFIQRQEKIFLVGPNGCGKTSLLKLLLGIYPLQDGFFKIGSAIDIGYYDQAQGNLDESKTVIDEIWDLHPSMTQTEVRNALAVFLFKGEDVFKPVKGLSGGERARVLLLKLMLQKTNFLILDEPTNHLDISSREALEDALLAYDGTLLIVSHDRYLINKLSTKILSLEKHSIKSYIGNYDDYLNAKMLSAETQKIVESPKQNEYKLNKERKAQIRKMKSALEKCEKAIEENEIQLEKLGEQLILPEVSIDYTKTLEISCKMDELRSDGDSLMEKWEELHLWLEENQE
ncbi:MAG: ABC-F family ATP-binding cassette domain-containing protein [Clostridia bacterium]